MTDLKKSPSGTPVAVTGGGNVTSVFGRTGVVAAQAGDYNGSQVTGASNVPGATVAAELDYFAQTFEDKTNFGAAPSLDFTVNRYIRGVINANAVPTVVVPPAGIEVILELVQPAAGGPFTWAWPAAFKWTDDLAPTLTTTASKRDFIRAISNGTQLIGWAQAMNVSA